MKSFLRNIYFLTLNINLDNIDINLVKLFDPNSDNDIILYCPTPAKDR